MNWLSHALFGNIEFPESEELREFQYKFLILLQIFGAVTSALYVALAELGAVSHFNEIHVTIISAHSILMA